jgi:hypothetical protein
VLKANGEINEEKNQEAEFIFYFYIVQSPIAPSKDTKGEKGRRLLTLYQRRSFPPFSNFLKRQTGLDLEANQWYLFFVPTVAKRFRP